MEKQPSTRPTSPWSETVRARLEQISFGWNHRLAGLGAFTCACGLQARFLSLLGQATPAVSPAMSGPGGPRFGKTPGSVRALVAAFIECHLSIKPHILGSIA